MWNHFHIADILKLFLIISLPSAACIDVFLVDGVIQDEQFLSEVLFTFFLFFKFFKKFNIPRLPTNELHLLKRI